MFHLYHLSFLMLKNKVNRLFKKLKHLITKNKILFQNLVQKVEKIIVFKRRDLNQEMKGQTQKIK